MCISPACDPRQFDCKGNAKGHVRQQRKEPTGEAHSKSVHAREAAALLRHTCADEVHTKTLYVKQGVFWAWNRGLQRRYYDWAWRGAARQAQKGVFWALQH